MDKFILGENPRTGRGLSIIHLLNPIAIFLILEGHHEIQNHPSGHFTHKNSDGGREEYTLVVHHLFTTNIGAMDDLVSKQMISKLMNKAWHWYASYLAWEDDQAHLN